MIIPFSVALPPAVQLPPLAPCTAVAEKSEPQLFVGVQAVETCAFGLLGEQPSLLYIVTVGLHVAPVTLAVQVHEKPHVRMSVAVAL